MGISQVLTSSNFWELYGLWLGGFIILSMVFFPRLTMLCVWLIPHPLGPLFPLVWAGWVLAPRIVVAAGVTFMFAAHNPILILAAWMLALVGEVAEKLMFLRWGQEEGSHR